MRDDVALREHRRALGSSPVAKSIAAPDERVLAQLLGLESAS